MIEFGQELRREREARGISLDAITNVTKISNRHLVALETDHFDVLPGGVINKGIVRGYARTVGLDECAWLERFMAAYRESGQLKDDDANWIAFAENVQKNRPPASGRPAMRLRWAGVAVLLVILAALGWFVWHYVSNKMSAQVHVPQNSITASTIAQPLRH
ncbi:MAG TPA: helix-turn-helix domain-containing protein [Acidobacteriaceae bacterium]|nr:helix-turn-helix domain-containing protein [Acidobacteriaceae bacterium]